jgi:hypothetical protein
VKRTVLYAAGVLCLTVIVCQLMTFFGGQSWGFSHEVWRTDTTTGHHSNRGAIMSRGGVYVFFESEHHPVPPDGNTWWSDKNRVDSAGSPPQFTVANTTSVRNWRIFMTGYEYSTRTLDWQGQYHLISIHPLVLWFFCVAIILIAARRAAIARRARMRELTMLCIECGYDLRGGHERCPECGTVVVVSAVRTEANQ